MRTVLQRIWRRVPETHQSGDESLGVTESVPAGPNAGGDGNGSLAGKSGSSKLRPSRWGTVGGLRPFVMPHWRVIALAFFLLLGEAGMGVLKPWPIKMTLDLILRQQRLAGVTLQFLVGIAVLVVGVAVFEGLLGYFAAFLLNRAGRTIVFELRVALFDHIQRLSLQFHSTRSSGDLMTRVTSDVKSLKDVMTESIVEILKSGLFLIGMCAVLFWQDWKLTLVVLAAAPVLFVSALVYSTQIKERSRAERKREGTLASVIHETLGTMRLTRVFNQEEKARKKFQAESAASLQSGLAASMLGERFSWVVDVLEALVIAAVLVVGIQRVVSEAITAGTLILFVSYARTFYKPLRMAVKHSTRMSRAAAQADRVVELLSVKEVVVDLPGAKKAPRFQGEIEFRNVCFEYLRDQPVLKAIDLVIPAGQVTAIVGPTGGGKSTLVSLIPRLWDPTRGEVLIDGHNLHDYTLLSLRGQISVVLQESVLLRASIAENIAYGRPDATVDDIVAAAKAAHAHDFIMELPEGYDTEVGERGETLSGGQRQRIAIARAIVRHTPIVILDEPLAGLDALAAAAVMEALEELMRDKTVIMITHHLSVVGRADRVIVLEDGQVVQQGTHDELVGVEGRYRRLFQAQFKDVLAAQS